MDIYHSTYTQYIDLMQQLKGDVEELGNLSFDERQKKEGVTAIMEQIAKELDIAIVSYSMTHHTRQSALGLPFIVKKNYQGEEYDVSEYTMSEIIASVYESMEKSGKKEGILFLDEIKG